MLQQKQLVKDNIESANNYKLSEEENKVIEKVTDVILNSGIIPCTGCQYCMPCPFSVNIAKTFRVYNQYKLDGNFEKFKKNYESINEENRPDKCVSCYACTKVCPQGIDIPKELNMIKELSEK